MNSYYCPPDARGLERVRYFPRQLITADDMVDEQEYFRLKMRRHNRYLHGWGVVCGLQVVPGGDSAHPWKVKVHPGYALSPGGDEIELVTGVCFDLAECLGSISAPCDPAVTRPVLPKSGKLFLAVAYSQCATRPLRVLPLGCSCDEMACENSRWRDDFTLCCVETNPVDETPVLCEIENGDSTLDCQPCLQEDYVVLAEITLPDLGKPVEAAAINQKVRRRLHSTAVLQKQVIECCCRGRKRTPQPLLDLKLRKAGTVTGDTIEYTITVENPSTDITAQDVIFKDTLPVGLTLVAPPPTIPLASAEWITASDSLVEASLGDFAPGQILTFRFSAKGLSGEYTNKANISALNSGGMEAGGPNTIA